MTRDNDQSESAPPILIVDDDPRNLLALEAVLDSLRCRVVRAESGSDAVERCRSDDFAAVLMDVRMPGLDGYAAASFIRQDARSARTPILFITGHDIDVAELTRTFGNTGQVESLQKPFDADVLRAKVRWWIELFRKGTRVHDLERAMDSFRAQARTKDDVLAAVAHDLKGPLSAVRLAMCILQKQTVEGVAEPAYLTTVRRQIDRALRNVDRMTTIVDDLLDTARIESGTVQLELAPHEFEDILVQAVDLLQPLADQKGLELAIVSERPMGFVVCDRDRILQVFSNLIGNALKFTPAGGKVQIGTTGEADAVVVSVLDTGPGISSHDLPRVFQKYWQGERQPGHKGIGLGLTIAKEIVLAHGGNIWAESRPNEGSRFLFSIPRRRDDSGSNGHLSE
jgi:two-component system sensor histidine kinase/response regulator